MNSKYTGKLVEYLLDKISSLSSGNVGDFIGLLLLDKFLRKDLDERTPHSLASDKKLEVGNFVSGAAGAVIYIDENSKQSIAEVDKLYVRLKAFFEQLEIINVNSVGGKLIISPAGGIKCSLVETYDSWGYYRCYFLSELDGEKIENRFAVGDLAYSKTFNAREGSYNKISNRYYYRLVVGAGENYIDLSKTDCDADSDEPQEGDVIVHRGNRNDVDRLNCLEFSSVDSFSPSITLYQGINDYSLADKNVIQFGVEKSTGKAFMNVYGDMFIGNRDNSSYIRYSPEKGVEIKGKLDIGTSFGDKTLLDAIDLASTAYEEDLNNLKDIVNRDIENILNLLDGAIETWFYDPAPTLTNLPASLWTTESDKNIHLGDLYYSGAGRAYRFQYDADNSLYYWQEIVDTDIVLALENAKKAQDTADSKRKIFVRKPEASDSYDIGDMWVNASYSDSSVTYKEDLLRAILSKEVGEQFSITHWTLASKYTDDTIANDALEKATNAQESVNNLLNDVTTFKGYVDGAFLDGVIDTSEALAIEKYINQLDTIKQQVDKSYEEIIKNSILENTTYLTNLNNSYTAFSSSYTELINTINSAISDSKTTDLEKAAVDGKYKTFNDKYRDYTAYLNLAINYIEETINGKVERALLDIGGYKYLKAALLENTSIEGGLIQSSMLSLGYTKNNLFLVMAGTNGLVLDKGDRTIASWFGGGMIDMFDYYDSNTKTFNIPEDVRAAAGLDRMDGTGYRAKGNLWWDETGVVHADPLSFFVGESTVGGLLASFLVVMKEDGKHPLYLIPQVPFLSLEIADYIRIGDALLKYDSASKAIYVTSADGTTSMGFYASGYVSALGKNSSGGSTGSASALYQLVDVLSNSTNDGVLNAANGSVLMYNGSKWQAGNVVTDISPLTLKVNDSSLFTYDGKSSITANLTVPTKVSQLTNDTGFITGISSSMVINALGYTPYNSTNPNGYISSITKAMVEGVLTGNITSHTHSYLPLSGGTMTGPIKFSYNNNGNCNVSRASGFSMFYGSQSGATNYGFPFQYSSVISFMTGYCGMQFANYGGNGDTRLLFRNISDQDTWTTWYTLLHSGNYNSYTPTLTGSGASGTWGISITGNAATATDADTLDGLHEGSFSKIYDINISSGSTVNVYDYAKNEAGTRSAGNIFSVSNWSWAYSAYIKLDDAYSIDRQRYSIISCRNGDLNSTWQQQALLFIPTYDDSMIFLAQMRTHDVAGAVSTTLKRYADYNTIISGNVASATKLQTARTIWGRSFDGTANVSGNLYLDNQTFIYSKNTEGSNKWIIGLSNDNTLYIGGETTAAKYSTYLEGYNIYFRSGNRLNNMIINSSGNVLIGTTNDSGAKLQVTDTTKKGAIAAKIKTSALVEIGATASGNDALYIGQLSNSTIWIQSAYGGDSSIPSASYTYPLVLNPLGGNVGIGTISPAYKLDVNGTAKCSNLILPTDGRIYNGRNYGLYVNDYTNGYGSAIYLTHDHGQTQTAFRIHSHHDSGIGGLSIGFSTTEQNYGSSPLGATYAEIMHMRGNGNVGIGTTSPSVKLHVIGDIAATGAVTAKASSSDIRLKTDITDYKALSIIRSHKSIKYHWNAVAKANADIFNDDYWHYGLIAQDVQRDMPQMVSDVFKDYLVINYERLIPICWKGLQEVDDEVTRLKKKVRKLEMEIRELKQERA